MDLLRKEALMMISKWDGPKPKRAIFGNILNRKMTLEELYAVWNSSAPDRKEFYLYWIIPLRCSDGFKKKIVVSKFK